MTTASRLVQPAVTYAADNDNKPRCHRAPVMDRAKQNKLFPSAQENILAIRTIERMDQLLSLAESDVTYTKAEDGHYFRGDSETDADYIGQSVSTEVAGRSAEMILEDVTNGTVTCHPPTKIGYDDPLHIHGRFKFNADGIIMGYRLNRTAHGNERDTWVTPSHSKYPDNVVTPRDGKLRDPRGRKPGKTSAIDIVTPANDNFDARSCVTWIRARMAPEHYAAIYDVTAGLGFNQIGTAAGFSGKPADAVGKDRVMCGLRQAARLLAEWDDTCT